MMKQTKDLDLESFVDKLLEDKKLPNDLDQEVILEMKKDLMERVEDRINALIVSHLSPDKMEEFSGILDSRDENQIQAFLETNIQDLPEIIASELILFKQTYLA